MRSSRINIEGKPIFRHHKNIFLYTYLLSIVLLAAGCSEHANGPIPETKIQIPRDSDWVDEGTVLAKGDFGSWEVRLEGAISPGAMVKKNGVYFLYYIGADGDRSSDKGPRHRALGVATSSDGIHFVKHTGNPIIEFLPHHNEEEGIFSVAAMIDADGTVLLFYGAMDAGNATSTSVDSDCRLAVSNDGTQFNDMGDVLSHSDKMVWGYGDELFPVGAFRFANTYYVYYIAKGKGAYWNLGLAWGSDKTRLTNSRAVIESGDWIVGGGDAVILDDSVIALFLFRVSSPYWKNRYIDIRKASVRFPSELSARVETYVGLAHTLVYFDRNNTKWFMYYFNGDGNIGARWAVSQLSND